MISVGTAVPDKVMTNFDFEKYLDTSDEWIVQRTGIRTRHIMDKDIVDPAMTLGSQAVLQALRNAGIDPSEVDALFCATATPDNFFPSTACCIARNIGCPKAFAFDLSAACTGLLYGVTLANSLILTGQCKTVVVVGTEVLSRILDWNDRTTCILFGDAAGAVVIRASDDPDRGILGAVVAADCTQSEILKTKIFDGRQKMSMNGQEVYKSAVRLMSEVTRQCLKKCSLTCEDIDVFVPHQANIRIMESVAGSLKIPPEKVIFNVAKYGNTSSASIPLALQEWLDAGRIQKGMLLALTALGGGLTYGSVVMRF